MRYALLALVLVGCSNVARTSLTPPPKWTDEQGNQRCAAYVLAPVYPDDRRLVFLACERAMRSYLEGIDDEDAEAGRLHVHAANAWFGACDVTVTLAQVDGGTRVDVAVEHTAELFQQREMTVLEKYVRRVDLEMHTIRDMQAVVGGVAQPHSP